MTPALLLAVSLISASADGVLTASHSKTEGKLDDLNPKSKFWAKTEVASFNKGPRGEQHPHKPTEVRVRWTKDNLWVLYVAPYEKMYLKPDPQTTADTNKLWDWDVCEMFIGADFNNIERYREFQVSPQNEWVDLDIRRDEKKTLIEWNSGYKTAAKIDKENKIWYGLFRIPISSITTDKVAAGTKFRANFYRIEDGPPNRKFFAWRELGSPSYHTPAKFGILELVK
jgi:hypothetical protein